VNVTKRAKNERKETQFMHVLGILKYYYIDQMKEDDRGSHVACIGAMRNAYIIFG
jgi:hypothetical protein